ncbi:WAT1-related protein [Vitis vinifera]|uniref:WAT1-related protein n=1 Tax=Vitis vinifera TaxID=29760 RepID=A0A438CNK1_VITVI|nr:WAT1-related protein [Vitis vinifera]
MAGTFSNLLEGLKPVMVMVIIQIAFGGINIFYKLATNDGMSVKIMVAYRMMFAAASMVPLALILEWKSRPKLTRRIFILSFFLGIFGGSLSHNLYAESLALTSATFVAAMSNLIPAMTFVMAIILRMESLAIRTNVGKAKVLGTILSIGGAMILTFYKGVEMNIWSTNINLLHHHHHHDMTVSQQSSSGNQALGGFLGVASAVSMAIWMILQAKLSMVYPSYSATALMSICASIQSVVYALCTERDWSAWKLGWNIRLVTVVYTGVVGSGLMVALMTWVARRRGALFISSFYPLLLVVVAIAGSLMLDEKLHVGSVLWGKSKEMMTTTQLNAFKSSKESESRDIAAVEP